MPSTTSLVEEMPAVSPKTAGGHTAVSKTGLKYRADVDGLRAVAVLSVIAFHIGISRFGGGFVGVDVFFVISGYLISSIIFAEISASRFTIVGFYERRIRRIFPALFAVLAAASIVAYIFLLPGELVDYAKSMLAATTSVSNFFFWLHSGYFDQPTSKPLLHTWSLAVEEQFYLTFPLLLLLVQRFSPKRLRLAVGILFLASFAISCVVVLRSQVTAFYMPYTRAWELLLGTLLSLKVLPKVSSLAGRNVATVAGIGMILASVLLYTQETVFPGFSALLPCVGSALIIWAGEAGGSVVGSVLSWRPVVFIGLISYSLYLWHWLIVVMQKAGLLVGLSAIGKGSALISGHRFDMIVEVGLSFVLAVLSWRFVERPFRSGALRLSGRPLFLLASGVLVLFLGCGTWMVLAQGFPSRFPTKALQVVGAVDSQQEFRAMRTGTCFITTEYHFAAYDSSTCLREDKDKKNYLLLGDSHSAMLYHALATEMPNANVMQASTAACAPSLAPTGSPDCKKMMSYIFEQYLPTHSIAGLLLAGRWEPTDIDSVAQIVAWAAQHQVPIMIFGPVPEYDAPLPRLLAYSIAWNKPKMPSSHLVAGPEQMDSQMQELATTKWHVPYISLYKEICKAGGCLQYADTASAVPMMSDDNHLSTAGASFVIRQLVDEGRLN
jgi:peptidoglycan/LPS O-acetylase OafA/YrhL